ncbi:MAG: heparan-alpha-glucosaminide N-acetyltransferase [Gallionella sp.]|nr:heparan-alpha-glucosaminide N-acetyltransferase [Gallionella sp.]
MSKHARKTLVTAVMPAADIRAAAPPRYAMIDALRGFAIVLMIAYHFSFDLNYHGWIHQDFNNAPFWLTARAAIVSLFLLLVGISLVLNAQRPDSTSFWRRQGRLLAACLAVSLGSYLMFPESFIFFGILHFILFASLAGRLFVRLHYTNLAVAVLVLAAGWFYSNPLFNAPPLQWLGFMTYKPLTEDYVPFFPWFGVVLAGIFIGKLIFSKPYPALPAGPRPGLRQLAFAGRHSLLIYLLHQPVLLGILTLVALS